MDIIATALAVSALVLLALLTIGVILTIRVVLLFKEIIDLEIQKTEKGCDNAKESQKTD